MDKEHNGARVALDEVLGRAEPEPVKRAQLTLDIGAPTHESRDEFAPEETHAADLLGLPKVAEKRALVSANNAGKGRPRGRHNTRTEAWVGHLLKRYPSPLETLAQIQASPVDVLATELHCSRLEALIQKRHAAEALAPFVHQKLASIEIKPPGHPDGEPVLLTLSRDFEETDLVSHAVIEAVAVEAAQKAADEPSVATLSWSDDSQAASTRGAPLTEIDANDQGNDDPADAAIDALIELARDDPERAARIRQRLASLLE
jgi:hypothetical protein